MNAALAIADRDGYDALTIRAIAELIDAPPMSLYTYFANKEELLDLMYAEVSRRMYDDQGHATWQLELVALCRRIRQLLKDHPEWALLLSRPVPPLAIPMRERVLKLMVADGVPETDAFRALSSAALVTIGMALVELNLKGPRGESAVQERFERLKKWALEGPVDDHRETRVAVAKLGNRVVDEVFEFTVRVMMTGFETLRATSSRREKAH